MGLPVMGSPFLFRQEVIMNYEKLKERIMQAVNARPLDFEAYDDMFALFREYEKEQFMTAHKWNQDFRTDIGLALRYAVDKKDFQIAERFNALLQTVCRRISGDFGWKAGLSLYLHAEAWRQVPVGYQLH